MPTAYIYSSSCFYLYNACNSDMRHLTTGIRSEKCVVRRFRLCANVYLHKPRQYNIAYYTPRLYGIAYCSYATNLYSMLLQAIVTLWYYNIVILWDHCRMCGPSLTETSLWGAYLYFRFSGQ